MPVVDRKLKQVKIEPYNLGRFGVEIALHGHYTLTFTLNPLVEWVSECLFTVVSGVPFEKAAEIANKLPSRRNESHSDKPDPNIDSEGKTPKDGGEIKPYERKRASKRDGKEKSCRTFTP